MDSIASTARIAVGRSTFAERLKEIDELLAIGLLRPLFNVDSER